MSFIPEEFYGGERGRTRPAKASRFKCNAAPRKVLLRFCCHARTQTDVLIYSMVGVHHVAILNGVLTPDIDLWVTSLYGSKV